MMFVMDNRIQELRKKQGMTLAQLAEKTASTPQQIGRLEKGERRLTTDWMEKIASALNVLPEDLMTDNHGERVVIPEINLNTLKQSTLPQTSPNVAEADNVLSEWAVPKQLLANQVGAESTMRIIQVMGDSMIPEFNPGDRVMVNTADRSPSPPGVFVLWDGFGLIIKRCEMVPHSSPPRAILSSSNINYSTYEMDLKELDIQGRVVGKWQWT
jgi:phage repressor protein C with HTH and peptisase S24 domain